MSEPRWRWSGFRPALAIGGILLFVWLPLADLSLNTRPASGPFMSLAPTRLEAELGRSRLELQVTSLSAQHEAELRAVVDDVFPGQHANIVYRRAVLAPGYWIRASRQALTTVAALESGRVTLEEKSLQLTGITRNDAAFRREWAALVALLPEDIQVSSNVGVVPAVDDMDTLCREAFGAFADVHVPFERASAELRSSAHGVLDRLVEFAFDCRGVTIRITGHTDNVGDEAWNRKLSLLRSAAVATYLARAGVDPARLEAVGAGSSQPIADNDTAYGRSRNRRIEFTLR